MSQIIHPVSSDVAYLEAYISDMPTHAPTGDEHTDKSATIIPGLQESDNESSRLVLQRLRQYLH